MKTVTYTSPTHGTYATKIDDDTFSKLRELGGTWSIAKKRGKIYFQKHLNHRVIELHRWIMGFPKGLYVDHISRDTLDNRRENLRICTNAANLRNGGIRLTNTSGATGVWFSKRTGKWEAEIKVQYRKIWLGSYIKFAEALKARREAEKRYFDV